MNLSESGAYQASGDGHRYVLSAFSIVDNFPVPNFDNQMVTSDD